MPFRGLGLQGLQKDREPGVPDEKPDSPAPLPEIRDGVWKSDSSCVWDVFPGLERAALEVTVLLDFRLNSLYRLGTLV